MRLCVLLMLWIPLQLHGQPQQTPLWKIRYDTAQFYWKSNIHRSIVLLKEAEQIASNDLGIYDENYLTILNDLGLANSEARNYKKAEECLSKSLSIRQELYHADDPKVLESKCNLASVFLKSGSSRKAKPLYWAVVRHGRNPETSAMFVIAAENLINVYESEDDIDSSLFVVNSVLPAADVAVSGDYEFQLAKGRLLRKSKKYDDANLILQRLYTELSSSSSPSSHEILAGVQAEVAIIDIQRGLYIEAEKNLLPLYRSMKSTATSDANLLTSVTNEIGFIYDKIGVWDKALAYYNESLNRCVASHGLNSLNCVIMQNNIAGVYLKQERIAEAIAMYEQVISTLKNVAEKDNETYLTAITNLSTAYRQDGQYDKSLSCLKEVYEALKAKNKLNSDLAAAVMNNMAVSCTLSGDFAKATEFFERVYSIKKALYGDNSPVLLDIVNNLAVSNWALKRFDKAIPLFEKSLSLAATEVKYIFPNLTEAEQIQFYRQQKQNFERFNTLAVQSLDERPEVLVYMFNNQLLLKSLTFFTTKKRDAQIAERNDESLKALANLIGEKGIQLGHAYQIPAVELQTLDISIPELEKEVDSLQKVMRHRLHQEKQDESFVAWNDVRASLGKNEAAVEMIRFRKYDLLVDKSGSASKRVSIGFTDSVYYAALITTSESTNAPSLVLLKNGNYLETRFFNYYRNTLIFDIDDTLSYALYWKPFEKSLTGKQKIYFSADGVFHQINLNAIHDQQGKYILERYDLTPVMNSGQLVKRSVPSSIDLSQIILFGDPDFTAGVRSRTGEATHQSVNFRPLPGSLEEVKGILSLLKVVPSRKNLFLQQAANETNLRSISGPSILHIATHGFFSSRFVYLNEKVKNDFLFHSGLVLSPSGKGIITDDIPLEQDGIFTAYDVMGLDLGRTDLVVLSACETGLGKIEIGEGVFGLQRSFLQAGARDVLVSLWKVEDGMTKDLMIRFYSHLSEKKNAREAFRIAQLDMLEKVGNPRLWAGFVMVGSN